MVSLQQTSLHLNYLWRFMRAIVTIFKSEFEGKEGIANAIIAVSETKDIGEAFVLIPQPGKLFELLNLLKDNNIQYGTHFNSVNEGVIGDKS